MKDDIKTAPPLPEAPSSMGTTDDIPRDYQASDSIGAPDGAKQWAGEGPDVLFPSGFTKVDPKLDPDCGDHEMREDLIYGRPNFGSLSFYENYPETGVIPTVKERGTGKTTSTGFIRRNNIKYRY